MVLGTRQAQRPTGQRLPVLRLLRPGGHDGRRRGRRAGPRARPPDRLCGPRVDPPGLMAETLSRMGEAISLGDVIADCGYSNREPRSWARPLRSIGASLVIDLHPNDRGIRGDFEGALSANGHSAARRRRCCCSASARCAGEPRARRWPSTTNVAASSAVPALPVRGPR